MTNTNELLSCPFCGTVDKEYQQGYHKNTWCSNPNCRIHLIVFDKIEWNTRVESQQSESLKSENDRLKKALDITQDFITRNKMYAKTTKPETLIVDCEITLDKINAALNTKERRDDGYEKSV